MILGSIKQLEKNVIKADFSEMPSQHSANFEIAVDTIGDFVGYKTYLSIGYSDGSNKAECVPVIDNVATVPPACFKHNGRVIMALTFTKGDEIINTKPISFNVFEAPALNQGEAPNTDSFFALVNEIVTNYVDGYAYDLVNLVTYSEEAKTSANEAKTAAAEVTEKLKAIDTKRMIPEGGTTGQVLKKKSNTSYDTEWGNPPTVTTDSYMSATSTNPVQNKVVTAKINEVNTLATNADNRGKILYNQDVTLVLSSWNNKVYKLYNSKITSTNVVHIAPSFGSISLTRIHETYLKELAAIGIVGLYQVNNYIYLSYIGEAPKKSMTVRLTVIGD